METTITLSDLRRHDIEILPHEAVAVVQQLMCEPSTSTSEARPPYGPPSLDSVALRGDGSVHARNCAATPSVSEIAIVLEALLAGSKTRVAGGLRYAVGRALLEVEAPPFDSVAEFSAALERFERGERREIVAHLFRRGAMASAPAPDESTGRPTRERRQQGSSAAELRRELREADQRLYDAHQHLRANRPDGSRPSSAMVRRAPMAACMVAGVALLAAGEFVHTQQDTVPATQAVGSTPARTASPSTAAVGDVPLVAAVPVADTIVSSDDAFTGPFAPVVQRTAPARVSREAHAATRIKTTDAGIRRADRSRLTTTESVRTSRSDPRRARREPEHSDRGVIARIRFEWNNPFR